MPPCSFAAKRMPGRTHPSAEEVTEEKETEKFLQEKRQLCERCHRTGSSVRPFPGVERRRTAVRRCPPAALPAPRSIPPRTLAALVTLSARQHSQSGPKRGSQHSTAQPVPTQRFCARLTAHPTASATGAAMQTARLECTERCGCGGREWESSREGMGWRRLRLSPG